MAERRTETLHISSGSESTTEQWGIDLGSRLQSGLCICLCGALGSGKSVLARGICKGLGVNETVISPSFILYEEYEGRLPIIHCDFYRLAHEREIEDLGLFERISDDTVVVVEWGDRSPRIYEIADVVIDLQGTGPSQREVEIHYGQAQADLFQGNTG